MCLGGRVARYARDGEILGAGERTRCLGLVLSGTVYVLREDFWGNRNILTAAGPGEVFGESYACLPEEAIPIRAVEMCIRDRPGPVPSSQAGVPPRHGW